MCTKNEDQVVAMLEDIQKELVATRAQVTELQKEQVATRAQVTELQKELTEVKLDCKEIRNQLLGVSKDCNNPDAISEATTTRQILEEIAYDVKGFRPTGSKRDHRKGDTESDENEYPLRRVKCKTADYENALMAHQLETIKLSKVLKVGATYGGKTANEHLSAYTDRAGIVFEFSNFSNFGAVFYKQRFKSGVFATDLNSSPIPAQTKQLMMSTSAVRSSVLGIVAYAIESVNRLLLVHFKVNADGKSLMTLAITPTDIPIDGNTFDLLDRKVTDTHRMDVRRTLGGYGGDIIVKSGGIIARGKLTAGPKAVLSIEFCYSDEADLVEGDTPEIFTNIMSSVGEEVYSCSVFIDNRIDLPLVELRYNFLNLCTRKLISSEVVPALSMGNFTAWIFGTYLRGIITYKIDTTDLLVAVQFYTFSSENYFSVGIFPSNVSMDTLGSLMLDKDDWETRSDYKYGLAADGELLVELRNIRVRASMNDSRNSTLRISISAF